MDRNVPLLSESRAYLGFTLEEVAIITVIDPAVLESIERGALAPTGEQIKSLLSFYGFLDWNHELGFRSRVASEKIIALGRSVASISERDRDELTRFSLFLEGSSRLREMP